VDLILTEQLLHFMFGKLPRMNGVNHEKWQEDLSKYYYWIFRNPFYTGRFEYPRKSGNWHQGTYEPMITLEEYDRVQVILGKRGNPRPKCHIFEFTA